MMLPPRPAAAHFGQRAFTMIEMLIAVAVAGILAAIALPSYNSYIIKSEIRSSQADLLALSLNFENRYQRTLAYPVIASENNDTAGLKTVFAAWTPSASNFDYSLTVTETAKYTLKATGKNRQSGCSITLTSTNVRESSGCKYSSGAWL